MYRLELIDKRLPPTLNKLMRMHWGCVADENIYWQILLSSHEKPKKPLLYYRIEAVRYTTREIDFDNLVGSFKIIVDAARKQSIIHDDSYKNTGKWDVGRVLVKKRKEQKIKLIITEANS